MSRPRAGDEDAPELAEPERQVAAKYFDGPEMTDDGRHAWLCIAPLKLVS